MNAGLVERDVAFRQPLSYYGRAKHFLIAIPTVPANLNLRGKGFVLPPSWLPPHEQLFGVQ